MSKLLLVAGGTGVVSLAVGSAAGYFFAQRKFNQKIEPLITEQVENTKKHYSILLDEARRGKPESIMDIPISEEQDLVLEAEDPPGPHIPSAPIDEFVKKNADKSLTDYQGLSAAPSVVDIEPTTQNVFDTNGVGKKPLPPRDPITQRFVSRQNDQRQPAKIDLDEFVENPDEHEQVTLMYFENENVLLDPMTKETVNIAEVGQENLRQFPEQVEGVTCEIYVRNWGLGQDYDITKTTDELSDWLGLSDGLGNSVKDKANDQSQWV